MSVIIACSGCTDNNSQAKGIELTYSTDYDNYNFDEYEIPELNGDIVSLSGDNIVYCAYEQFEKDGEYTQGDNHTFYLYNIKDDKKTKLLNVRFNDSVVFSFEPVEINGHIYFFYPHNNKEKNYQKNQWSYSLYDIDLENKTMSEVFEDKGQFILYDLSELDGKLLIQNGYADKSKNKEISYIKTFEPKTKKLTVLLEKTKDIIDSEKSIYKGESILNMSVENDKISAFIQNYDENKWYVNTFEYKDNKLNLLKEIDVTFLGTGMNELGATESFFNYCNGYLSYENVCLMKFLGKVTENGLEKEIFSYKIDENDIISVPNSNSFSSSSVSMSVSVSNKSDVGFTSSDNENISFKFEDATFIVDVTRNNENQLIISSNQSNTICIFNNITGELQNKKFECKTDQRYHIYDIKQSGSKIILIMGYSDENSTVIFPNKIYYLDINDL